MPRNVQNTRFDPILPANDFQRQIKIIDQRGAQRASSNSPYREMRTNQYLP